MTDSWMKKAGKAYGDGKLKPGAPKSSRLSWILFPFFVISAGFVIAFYIVDFFVIDVWYLQIYFYAFFAAQIWLLAQFYMYISMKPPKLDLGDRYTDRLPDSRLTVVISCFNEPPDIVERTLRATRENFTGKIMLADDSTHGADVNRKLTLKYRVAHFTRKRRRGYKAGALNDVMRFIRTPYVALLDSDAVPSAQFFHIGLSYARAYEIVQFPQYFGNRGTNTVTKGSYAQQIPFLYRIMPLRSSRNSAFMLGTNLIFRKDAINSLGGFDESSVTEDLSTSVKFHKGGYRSVYISRNTVDNSAPESLKSYFIQQQRWATGTIGVFMGFLRERSRDLHFYRYADYFIGSSWYLYGLVFPLLASSVFIFSVFHVSFIFANQFLYYTLYLPFITLSFGIYYLTIYQTGHGIRDMFYNLSFNAICFPIYAKGVVSGITGRRSAFSRTPKGKQSNSHKYRAIIPQLTLLVILMTSMMVSALDALMNLDRITSIFNLVWAAFYFALLVPVYVYPY